jgi:hypothetical protein
MKVWQKEVWIFVATQQLTEQVKRECRKFIVAEYSIPCDTNVNDDLAFHFPSYPFTSLRTTSKPPAKPDKTTGKPAVKVAPAQLPAPLLTAPSASYTPVKEPSVKPSESTRGLPRDEIKLNERVYECNPGFINTLHKGEIYWKDRYSFTFAGTKYQEVWPPFVCQIKKRIFSKKIKRYLLLVDDGDGNHHKIPISTQMFWGIKDNVFEVGDWIRIVDYAVTIISPKKKQRFIFLAKIEKLLNAPKSNG